MNGRQAVIDALLHKEHDTVPYHYNFTNQALTKIVAYTGSSDIQKKPGACMNYGQYQGRPQELENRAGFYLDEFGVTWNRTGADKDIGVIEQPIIKSLENSTYTFPAIDESKLRAEYDSLTSNKNGRFTMAGFGLFFFERSWSLMGMENLLMNMIDCPVELHNFLDQLCNYYLEMLDIALQYDIDGVYFGDDWGQQKGLIMGPDYWRQFIKPYIKRIYDRVKSKGKFVVQHSCGDCQEIFPDLIDIGLDCYQTFQPEIYDIRGIKAAYGHDLTFWGGISTQRCLPFMTPEEVRSETIRIIRTMKPGGGYIAGPTHALPSDIPPENILAMIDVFQNQLQYL